MLGDKPISYWQLQETGGSTALDEQGATHGRVLGATLEQPGPWAGSTSYRFNGGCDGIDITSGAARFKLQTFSLEMWFSSNTVPASPFGTMFRWHNYGYQLMANPDGTVAFSAYVNGGANGVAVSSGGAVLDGNWHHLVVSVSATGMTMYVDGGLTSSASMPSPIYYGWDNWTTIARDLPWCSGNPPYVGHMAHVAFYDSALDLAQVQSHFRVAANEGIRVSEMYGLDNPGVGRSNRCHTGDPIDCATGNFTETITDLALPGRGRALAMSRSYNALQAAAATAPGPLGWGWTHSYAASLSTDAGGNVTVHHENGSTVLFTTTASGYVAPIRVISTLVRNGDGSFTYTLPDQRSYRFDTSGVLLSQSDRNGYVTSLAYSGGRLVSVTDPGGRRFDFGYDPGGRIASVTDPAGRRVSYAYDGAANLTSVTDVGGGVTRYGYDSNHRITTMTKPGGGVTTNVYDQASRVTSQTDPLNRTITLSYGGGATTITDPAGRVRRQVYDAQYNLTSLTNGYGTPQAATWTFTYDAANNRKTATDPNQRVTRATWDTRGNQLTSTDGLNRTTTVAYNSRNDPTTVTDPAGVATTLSYDARGNLVSSSTPLVGSNPPRAKTVVYNYGDASHPGDVTSVTDENGKVWRLEYDAAGYLSATVDPLGHRTTHSYDAAGRRTSTVAPRGNLPGANPADHTTSYAYNAFGDVVRVTDPLGHDTLRSYDLNGNLTTATDADGRLARYSYDAADQLRSLTRPDNTVLSYGYDGAGNLTSQTDGAGRATTYTYDPLTRLATVTDPGSRTTTYGYDLAGNLTSVLDPSNQTTTLTYDAASQLKTILYSDPATPDVTNISYDATGRRTSMTDGTGTSTWQWDSLGRLVRSANGAGAAVGYGYDLRSNLTSVVYPGGTDTVARSYDDAGRWVGVTDWAGRSFSFTYDANSAPASSAAPNSTASAYGVDRGGRLESVAHSRSGASLARFDYGRSAAGLLTSTASAGVGPASEAYGYTPLAQLASAGGASYSYDAADNLTKLTSGATLAYDSANQPTTLANGSALTTFAYDPRGNRTTTTASTGRVASYRYDQANRLVGAPGFTDQSAVAAGRAHSLSVTQGGTVWAWGDNSKGQLGDGSTTQRPTPVTVAGLAGVARVSGGANHSLALKSDGTVWAWGDNAKGQLGDGSTTQRPTPVQVSGLSGVVGISAGANHSLAVKSDGTVWAWGDNAVGQLGDGSATTRLVPVRSGRPLVAGQLGLTDVVAVAAGANHSLALKSDGTVWATGDETYGQLGRGYLGGHSRSWIQAGPQVEGIIFGQEPLSAVVGIAAGGNHSAAVKSDGTVWGWGSNGSGEIGNGSTADASWPVQASGVSGASAVAAGASHTLALKTDGTTVAWGANGSGQLGNGTTTNSSVATPVTALSGASALAAGSAHTLALVGGGQALGWGANGGGQLGTANTSASLRPTPVGMATYTYDGDGLRMTKTVPGSSTSFSWSVAEGLPLLLAENQTRYVYGPGGLPLERVDASGNAVFYHHDQLGSTRAVTDAAGAVVATYTYDAYGTVATKTGSLEQPFGFAGQFTDAETGFVYLRARYYDPATGQFITRDPLVGLTGQPYAYANNSPLNFTDPSGEIAWLAVLAVAWSAFEVGSTAVDAVSTAKTFSDPCASAADKLGSGGLFLAGVLLPGGGYSTAGRAAPQAAARSSDDIAVIGRQGDTAVAKDWAGHEVLDLPANQWSLARNDEWVQSVVERKMDVYVGSNTTWDNLWDATNARPTVFGRELKQFTDAGYRWDGWYLRAPGR